MAILVPRRIPHFQKPEGPVEIDWSNPINTNLSVFYIINEGAGLSLLDITNKNPAGIITGATWGVAEEGRILKLDGNEDWVDLGSSSKLKPETSDFSWVFSIRYFNDGADSRGDIFSDRQLGALGGASGVIFGKSGDATFDNRLVAVLEATDGANKNYQYDDFWSGNTGVFKTLTITWSNTLDRLRIYRDKEDVTSSFTKTSDANLTGKSITSNQNVFISKRPGSTGRNVTADFASVRLLQRELTPSEVADIHDSGHLAGLKPRRRWVPVVIQGGAGATVSVGLASELSTAQAISRQKQKAVGLSAETDTALATSPAKVTAVGLSTETDTAFSILRSKIKTAGLSNETDSAFSLIVSNAVNVGLSAETDSAFAISRLKQKPVGLSTETDAALSVNRSKIKIAGLGIETDVAFTISRSKLKALGLSSEVDQALSISSSGSLAVGLASELDVALVIGRLKQQILGLSTETDTSQPVNKIKTQQAGLSVESDSALDVTGSSGRVVGLATETDLAQSISRIKQRLIGLAPETDVALAVTIAGVTVVINTNAKETLKLLAENPTLTLSAENATLTLS